MIELLLTYDFPPMGGGIARWMGELARRYPAGDLIVSTGTVAGMEILDATLPATVDRLPIPARRLRTLQGLLLWSHRVTTLTREHQPGFVWCGNIRPAAYPAKWAHGRTAVPYGLIVHGGDLLGLQQKIRDSRIKRGMVRSLFDSAAVVVATSQWTARLAQVVLGELGLDSGGEKVCIVPLGTDPVQFRPGVDSTDLRMRYTLPEGRWLLTVARLVPHKGVDTTLHALAALVDAFPDLRYAVVGRGAYLGALQALAATLGLTDRVFFLTEVPDADLPALYCLAEVYVGASRETEMDVEGFGISLLEASACGVPIVAGRGGGVPDAVRDGETGILVDTDDSQALAFGIREVLGAPATAARLGLGGRRAVEEFFNWDRVVRDLRAISAERATLPAGEPAEARRNPR